jgi:hypothetical protein
VEVVAAATLYGLFSAWMLFPIFGVRPMLTTSAAALTWIEFVAVIAWGVTREDCASGSCSAVGEAAGTAVAWDLPGLAIAVVALAVADAVRRHRSGTRHRVTSEQRR